MKTLTEEQLAEVDRIIGNIETETDWGRDNDDNSIEVDDVRGTLREAARQVRRYLSTLETKEVVDA